MTSCRQPGASGAGRPAWYPVFLEGLRATGNVSEAARAATICRSRVYECRRRDPVFAAFAVPRRHALISMAFNMGGPRLADFRRMRAAIAAGRWEAAAAEALDSRWARQTGRRADEIAAMLRNVKGIS